MNDITELAELNRQIAARDQIIRALLPRVIWQRLGSDHPTFCWFCKVRTVGDSCEHTESCPYARAVELSQSDEGNP